VQRGLDAVTIAADQICNVLKIESTSEDVKEDEVKTELRGLIKQLADLGIADPGIMNAQGEYAGAFQADDFSSTSTLIYSADCKHQVFDRLTNHLLGEGSASRCGPPHHHPIHRPRPLCTLATCIGTAEEG
jgi:hypothetical protein